MAFDQMQKSSILSEPVELAASATDGVNAGSTSRGKRLVYVIGAVTAVVVLSFWHVGLAAVTGAVGLTLAISGRS